MSSTFLFFAGFLCLLAPMFVLRSRARSWDDADMLEALMRMTLQQRFTAAGLIFAGVTMITAGLAQGWWGKLV